MNLLLFLLLPIIIPILAAPVGVPVLGYIALNQIRRSQGRLYGLEMALFDVLLFPLLALDGILFGVAVLVAEQFKEYGIDINNLAIAGAILLSLALDFLIVRWAWRAVKGSAKSDTKLPSGSQFSTRKPSRRAWKLATVVAMLLLTVTACIFWIQRPHRLGEVVFRDSPNGHYSARAETYHAMRVFGGDKIFYRFGVQGLGGSLFKHWDIPVPIEKLSTGYLVQPIAEYAFDKHGRIEWAVDSSSVRFLVRDVEVFSCDPRKTRDTNDTSAVSQQHGPNVRIMGTVADSATGKPIVGARVADNVYNARPNRAPQETWTDANGRYELNTWYEEHTLAASAPGYDTKLQALTTRPFGNERTVRMDFQLQPASSVGQASPDVPGSKADSQPKKDNGRPTERQSSQAQPDLQTFEARLSGDVTFGPVIERTVETAVSGRSAIDLDTGKVSTGPQVVENAQSLQDWMQSTGVDALGMRGSPAPGLGGFDMVAIPVPNERWDISIPELRGILTMGKLGSPVTMSGKGELPATYLFTTREGGMGVLQIVGFVDKPWAVKIRYKLMEEVSEDAKTMETESSPSTGGASGTPAVPAATDGHPEKPVGPVLIYEVDPGSAPADATAPDMDKLLKVVDRRLNSGTEKLARVRKLDDGRIEVAMMRQNDEDKQRVERLLARPGTLEFRILANTRDDKELIERAKVDPSKTRLFDAAGNLEAWWVPVKQGEENSFDYPETARRTRKQGDGEITEILVRADPCNVTGKYVSEARAHPDERGRPCIDFTFNDVGGELFGKLTGDHLPDRLTDFYYKLGIILDGELYSAPRINDRITNRGQISGGFTEQEASDIADVLNAGSLPVRLRLVTAPAGR